MKYTFTLVLICFLSFAYGQKEEILFKVENDEVEVSEFKYIYEKTNQKKADYSEASINEYLELYKKFKLKVRRAKDMRLDTIPSLKKELDGYRTQLANSYLIDKEVTEKLIKEVYDRKQEDVDLSHILVNCKADTSPKDTMIAYQKIQKIYESLMAGNDFEKTAMLSSEDGTAKDNKGHIGYINAMLPNGFYPMETTAYSLAVGSISKPIRTSVGYHILKVNDKRPARGELEVAHIFIRNAKAGGGAHLKAKIDSIHMAIKNGSTFESLTKLSDDKTTADKDGYLGFFGINRYEKVFEDAAFNLKKDGEITKPFASSAGWHIIKRISKKEQKSYNRAKGELQRKIKRDSRYQLAQDAMIVRIKKESNFEEVPSVLEAYKNSLDVDFLSYKWKPSEKPDNRFLFKLGDKNYKIADLEEFLGTSSRKRQRLGRGGNMKTTAQTLYEDYVKKECLAYEESQLEKKYPEFKFLMREYQEGILLFEATKMEVWDKASQDSIGLTTYFDKLKGRGKYMWKERAEVTFFTIQEVDSPLLDKVRKAAATKSTEEVLAKFNEPNKTVVKTRKEVFEKGKNKVLDQMEWKTGSLSNSEKSQRDKSLNFMKIEKVLAPAEKSLTEARGYIVADYQDYLEKEWIQELQRSYKIEVNEKVLKKMIKK